MTCVNYSDRLNSKIADYKQKYLTPLQRYEGVFCTPTNLPEYLAYQNKLVNCISEVKGVVFSTLTFDAISDVNQQFAELEQKKQQQIKEINDRVTASIAEAEAKNQIEKDAAAQYNKGLTDPIRNKHRLLCEYKDALDDTFDHYGISPMDMSLSDDVTQEEFMTMLDSSLNICEKYASKKTDWFNKAFEVLKKEPDLQVQLMYVATALVVSYFLLPLIAPVVFYFMFKSVHGLYKDIDRLKLARSLMAQVDYARFVDETEFKVVEDVDTTSIQEAGNLEIESLPDYAELKKESLEKAKVASADINKICQEAVSEVKEAYAKMISKLETEHKRVTQYIESAMKDYVAFPFKQEKSACMSHKYTLGRLENRLDVTVEIPCKNIVFDDNDHESAINKMRLYLCNALLSVQVKQLTVDIYDPKNMSAEFAEFFVPETSAYIRSYTDSLSELIKDIRKCSQNNILELDNKTIDEYNSAAESVDMVTKPYRLIIILSGFEREFKDEKGEQFREYFKYSSTTGVNIWILDKQKWAGAIWVSNAYQCSQGVALEYTRELGKNALNTYTTALSTFKGTGIMYKEKYADKYLPEKDWWTHDTIKGINIRFGLENGDPTRGIPVVMGDANVHGIMGGATGAGKSATINQMLISLVTEYAPSELQIIYIDFKNVEAAKFTRGYKADTAEWMSPEEEQKYLEDKEFYTRISRIPHLRIISGTTDGEYALSIFEFLMKEMARRQDLINRYGVTKIQEMREGILKKYNNEKGTPKGTWMQMRADWDWYKPNVYDKYGDLPRILVIFDEFQVMYNPEFVQPKIIDQINGKITALTKLARAMACHLFFTSQSMKGTMPKDTMANFSLRAALRCTSDVSDELLGNAAASTITAKNGFIYTNDSAGQDKNANKFWRIPFLDVDGMMEYIEAINKLLEPRHEKHLMAEFYDEKMLVPARQLDVWYAKYGNSFTDPDTFILGDRAAYSTNKAPVNTSLQNDSAENIMLAAFERKDMMNLALTMLDNLRKKDVNIIINAQDQDTHTLMDVETLVNPSFLELSYPSQDVGEFIDAIDSMVSKREEITTNRKPTYIFCMQWERAPMISVDVAYKVQDKFKELLRRAPAVGVHFVMCCCEKMELPKFVPTNCKHHVSGLLTTDAFFFTENMSVPKLPDEAKGAGNFAIYEYGTGATKFCIYQHEFTKKLKSREVVIS